MTLEELKQNLDIKLYCDGCDDARNALDIKECKQEDFGDDKYSIELFNET